MAVLLIVIIKAPSESQSGFFGNIVQQYIEETSASISTISYKSTQFADINSLMAPNVIAVDVRGSGGPESDLDLSTVQENSIVAYGPASTDYIEKGGFKPNRVSEYTVQPGDLISFIASDYGVTINSILWANNLKDADSISPGQILRIPPVSGTIHKVQRGDTLATIAKKYQAEQERIIAFNDLNNDEDIREGDEIVVPDGRIIAAPVIVAKGTTPFATRSNSKTASLFSHLPNLGEYFFNPTNGFNWGKIHGRNGVDIANSCGTSIYASADGVATIVDASGWNGGFGKYIKLVHPNGTETLYAHLSKANIGQGQSISRGQIIGLMGTTGRSTGCHLHFEVHGAKNPLSKY